MSYASGGGDGDSSSGSDGDVDGEPRERRKNVAATENSLNFVIKLKFIQMDFLCVFDIFCALTTSLIHIADVLSSLSSSSPSSG